MSIFRIGKRSPGVYRNAGRRDKQVMKVGTIDDRGR
jgi:hypothetical protein